MPSFKLVRTDQGLGLVDRFSNRHPLVVRFDSPEFRKRLAASGRKSELIARAVRSQAGLRVLDCTAGLGRDSIVLAHLGCTVTLIERSPVIHELLADGLRRATADPALAVTMGRVRLVNGDAVPILQNAAGAEFDVAYLDPMFPEKSGSAAVRGEMQMLQGFLGVDEHANRLLEVALQAGIPRVVLKRPGRGSWDSPREPVHVFSSKGSKFEVYQ